MPLIRSAILAAWLLFLAACGQQAVDGGRNEADMPEKLIEEVLREHTSSLMSLPGVVGAGQGECAGEPCIIVLIVAKSEEILGKIPSEIEGYAVRVQETGEIRPLGR